MAKKNKITFEQSVHNLLNELIDDTGASLWSDFQCLTYYHRRRLLKAVKEVNKLLPNG